MFQQILEGIQVHFSLIPDSIYYMKKLFRQVCQWILHIIVGMIMFQSPFTTKQNKKQLVLHQEETFNKMNEVNTLQVMTPNECEDNTNYNECEDNTNYKKNLFCAHATTLEKTNKPSGNLPRDIGTWDSDDHPIVVDSATS